MELHKLKEPMTPRWRIQSVKGNKAICVPYYDARQVQQKLDEVCTPEKWQNTYDPETGASSIAIFIENDWVWKTDVGTDSNVEKIKGKASDAFKRAAVLWGVGRDLYQKGTKVLDAQGKNATTSKGKILYTGDQLSNYINGINESRGLLFQIVKNEPELSKTEKFKTLMTELDGLLKGS
jgi:hypothetical protein